MTNLLLAIDSIAMGKALTLMWQGMLGIFIVMVLISTIVWILSKIGGKK